MSLKKSQRQVQIMALLSKNQKGMSVPELYQALQRIGYKMSERTLRRDMLDLIPVFQITVTGKKMHRFIKFTGSAWIIYP